MTRTLASVYRCNGVIDGKECPNMDIVERMHGKVNLNATSLILPEGWLSGGEDIHYCPDCCIHPERRK